jgi:membrane-associated phospholipid phosphatase
MISNPRLTFHVRLEDLVALVFFLLNLLLRIIFRSLKGDTFSPADVLIIIPAVTLLLAKELVHYFLGGKPDSPGGNQGPGSFARPFWEIIRDWFPFLLILLMYYSLWGDATLLLVSSDRDRALITLDQRLFGFQASLALQRIVSPGLTSWMSFAYFYHIINIPLVACFVYNWRDRARFREMMSGIVVVTFLGVMGYLMVPAIGPMYTLRHEYTVPLHQALWLLNREMDFMDFARVHRDVFPSMHVAISFVVWLYARRNSKMLFWILSPLILSLWFSTLYLRYHYLIDVVAGLILAPLSYLLANWLFRRFGEIPVRVAIPARWAAHLPWLFHPPEVNRRQKVEERR